MQNNNYYVTCFITSLRIMVKHFLKNILSANIYKKLKDLSFLFWNPRIDTYSQYGEDLILRSLFEGKNNGFYVEVGAYHPIIYSNSYFFYKIGWRGINIDATPGSMLSFNLFRPEDINLEAAISDREENLIFHFFEEPALNTFNSDLAAEYIEKNHKSAGTADIRTTTLENILDMNLKDRKKIDFLSIDCEGMDYKILRSNNWLKYKPTVILIEDLEFDYRSPGSSKIYEFLVGLGYLLLAKTVSTLIFALENRYVRNSRNNLS